MRKVAVASALPALFASARISVPGSLIGALLAEWLATGRGIGSSILLYALVGVAESIVLAGIGMAP